MNLIGERVEQRRKTRRAADRRMSLVLIVGFSMTAAVSFAAGYYIAALEAAQMVLGGKR